MLQPDEQIVITQDDLYRITWEAYGDQINSQDDQSDPSGMPNDEAPVTSNDEPQEAKD